MSNSLEDLHNDDFMDDIEIYNDAAMQQAQQDFLASEGEEEAEKQEMITKIVERRRAKMGFKEEDNGFDLADDSKWDRFQI